MKKAITVFLSILIFVGIAMSISNFATKVYASPESLWGTTTEVTGYYLQLKYWMQGRWIEGNLYCIDLESNCEIVFGN